MQFRTAESCEDPVSPNTCLVLITSDKKSSTHFLEFVSYDTMPITFVREKLTHYYFLTTDHCIQDDDDDDNSLYPEDTDVIQGYLNSLPGMDPLK